MARRAITYPEIGELLAKALGDRAFRDKLIDDPVKTLKDRPYGLGPQAVAFFKSLDDKTFALSASRHLVKVDAIGMAGDMEA